MELQRTRPGTTARVRSATVATAIMALARWLRSRHLLFGQAAPYVDGAAPVIERVISEGTGELILFALEPRGLRVLTSGADAELDDFVKRADAIGAPLFGMNPALIDRMAHGLANKEGSADARGRLH